MTLQNWYELCRVALFVCAALLVAAAFWYIVSLAKDLDMRRCSIALIVSGLLLIATFIPYFSLESKIYPPGQCPNCEQSITSRYCEDCGWENDSYFEKTDRH